MIAHVVDHVQAGVDLLIEQYKGKPRLEGLLTSYLNQVQVLEDAIWSVITGRLIDAAVGVQLDVLGKLVGRPRRSAADDTYRARIRAQIRANRSLGLPSDIITIALLVTGVGNDGVSLASRGHASFALSISQPIDSDVAQVLHELLVLAKPLGVAHALKFSDYASLEGFACSAGDSPTTSAARGFAAGGDPTVAPGGRWCDVL